ncbi:arylsulfatase [Armatimonas sp.]|uniref:arylsulfatase n=1 Tax=Armatimonas sp. TaxID=1872638 RepID=UPI00374CB4B9
MKHAILSLVVLMAALFFPHPARARGETKPNIIVILVDDMGFADLGCYGSEIPTPNLDALAKNGVRFRQFYNTGRCCPTRAALLTGLYSHQAGVGHMTEDKGLPGYSGRLNDQCVTMAEVLKPAGYFTAMTGKWHVGQNLGVVPWERGFERSLNAAAGGFYQPGDEKAKLFLNGQANPTLPTNWYSTDLWTEYGIKFMDDARAAKKPFFLYLAHNAPHFPLQAPAEDIAKFRGKYKAGWDRLREERLARQKQLGLASKGWTLSPRPDAIKAWESLSETEKDRFDHMMATYAACVWHMDKAIGTLVSALKERGELDNTLILFMSDNGGNAEGGPNGTTKGEPTQPDSNWFSGQSWAWLQNTPFREYKHYTHEGGISTPLIAHWPKGIPANRNGAWESQPGHLVDIMATVVDVGGANYPSGKIKPKEGVSLRPAFAGKSLARPQPLFWEHEGNRAVREGRWKLVAKENQPWELYDIETDRSELKNLATKDPAKVATLAAKWDTWAARANVLPLGGWRGKKAPEEKASTKTRFTLKAGDHLDKADAPAIANRAFTITVGFDTKKATDGVLIAQGGASQGYALLLEDGKLVFAFRTKTGLARAATMEAVTGAHVAVAHVDAKGKLSLQLDGKLVGEAAGNGPMSVVPVDGLDVGTDAGGKVLPYKNTETFGGTITSVVIELEKK